jgi:lactoylglutathione lyase
MKLNLIVLKTAQLDVLADFYRHLGMEFEHHQHGAGPFHYSAEVNDMVFEIYPLPKDNLHADNSIRLGFVVDDLDHVLQILKVADVKIIQDARHTEWGYQAVIQDPDGRKIELRVE